MNTNKKEIKIFYAEDLDSDRILFNIAPLEARLSFNLTTANDGQEAMVMLNKSTDYRPDIIFLDLKMPFKDGHECLQEIRFNEKFARIPVIIFSASFHNSDVTRAWQNHANLFVQKPMDINEQIQIMKKLFAIDWKDYFPHPSLDKFVLTIKPLPSDNSAYAAGEDEVKLA